VTDESACTPDSVPAAFRRSVAAIHLGLPLPAGSSGLPAGSDGPSSSACAGAVAPSWPCSGWGLPSHPGRPGCWWSLTPPLFSVSNFIFFFNRFFPSLINFSFLQFGFFFSCDQILPFFRSVFHLSLFRFPFCPISIPLSCDRILPFFNPVLHHSDQFLFSLSGFLLSCD
jgi:hypothetical protein